MHALWILSLGDIACPAGVLHTLESVYVLLVSYALGLIHILGVSQISESLHILCMLHVFE